MFRDKHHWIFIFLIICLLITGIAFYSSWHRFQQPLEIKTLNVSFTISSNPGFAVSSDALNFGNVIPEESALRTVKMSNSYNHPIHVLVSSTPELMNFLTFEPSFDILPGKERSVSFTVNIPRNASYAHYTGKVQFAIFKY